MHQQLLGQRGCGIARPQASGSASSKLVVYATFINRPFYAFGCQRIRNSAHRLRQSVATQSAPVAAPSAEPAPASDSGSDSPRQSSAYPFTDIEGKWQAYWLSHKTFRTPEEIDTSKPKYYVLDMFPYPRRAAPHMHAHNTQACSCHHEYWSPCMAAMHYCTDARGCPSVPTAAPGCMSAIPRATPPLTSWPATSACAASTCCIPWAGTRSGCPQSSTRSR